MIDIQSLNNWLKIKAGQKESLKAAITSASILIERYSTDDLEVLKTELINNPNLGPSFYNEVLKPWFEDQQYVSIEGTADERMKGLENLATHLLEAAAGVKLEQMDELSVRLDLLETAYRTLQIESGLSSTLVQEAVEMAGYLRKIRELMARIEGQQQEVQGHLAKKNLELAKISKNSIVISEEINRINRTELQGLVNEVREIITKAKRTVDEAYEEQAKPYAELTTEGKKSAQQGKELYIEKLEALARDPSQAPDGLQTKIPDGDINNLQPISRIIEDMRREIRIVAVTETLRLLKEAEDALSDPHEDRLDYAIERVDEARKAIDNRYVNKQEAAPAGEPGVVYPKEAVQRTQDVRSKISKAIDQRKKAQAELVAAASAPNFIDTLLHLDRAKAAYPMLPGLDDHQDGHGNVIQGEISRQKSLWINNIKSLVRDAIRTATLRRKERKYDDAFNALKAAERELAKAPRVLDLDYQEFSTVLEQARTDCETEQASWQRCGPILSQLAEDIPPVTDNNEIDPSWVQERQQQFAADELARFAVEWQKVQDRWKAKVSGAKALQEAQALYLIDPLDTRLTSLLGDVGKTNTDGSPNQSYPAAQKLLNLHNAHLLMGELEQLLKDPGVFKDEDAWLEKFNKKVIVVRARIQAGGGDHALEEGVNKIETIAQAVVARLSAINQEIHKNEFDSALSKVVLQPGDPADARFNRLLQLMARFVLRSWRMSVMTPIQQTILDETDGKLKLRPGVTIEAIREAVVQLNALAKRNGLTELGDEQRRKFIVESLTEGEITSVLGKDWAKISAEKLDERLSSKNIDALKVTLANLSRLNEAAAVQAWMVVIKNISLKLPVPEIVPFLFDQWQANPRFQRNPILCSLIVILSGIDGAVPSEGPYYARLTEFVKNQGASEEVLLGQLESVNHNFLYYRERVEKTELERFLLVETNFKRAEDELRIRAGNLAGLFEPGFKKVLEAVSDWIVRRWRDALGKRVFEKAKALSENAQGNTVLLVYSMFNAAKGWLGASAELNEELDSTSRKVPGQVNQLIENIKGLIAWDPSSPGVSLGDQIRQAGKLESYARVVIESQAFNMQPWFNSLSSLKTELGKKLQDDLDDSWAAVYRLEEQQVKQLALVLDDTWDYPTVHNENKYIPPYLTLYSIPARLEKYKESYWEIAELVLACIDTIAQIKRISEKWEDFKRAFSSLNENKEDGEEYFAELNRKFSAVILAVNEADIIPKDRSRSDSLAARLKGAYTRVGLAEKYTHHERLTPVFDKHFKIVDSFLRYEYDPAQNDWVGSRRLLSGLSQAKECLEEKRRNWEEWVIWIKKVGDQWVLLQRQQDELIYNLNVGYIQATGELGQVERKHEDYFKAYDRLPLLWDGVPMPPISPPAYYESGEKICAKYERTPNSSSVWVSLFDLMPQYDAAIIDKISRQALIEPVGLSVDPRMKRINLNNHHALIELRANLAHNYSLTYPRELSQYWRRSAQELGEMSEGVISRSTVWRHLIEFSYQECLAIDAVLKEIIRLHRQEIGKKGSDVIKFFNTNRPLQRESRRRLELMVEEAERIDVADPNVKTGRRAVDTAVIDENESPKNKTLTDKIREWFGL